MRHPMYGSQSTCLFSWRALLSISSRWGSLQFTQQRSTCRSGQLLGNVMSIIPHPPSLPAIKSRLQRPWYKYRFFPLNSKHLMELSKALSLSQKRKLILRKIDFSSLKICIILQRGLSSSFGGLNYGTKSGPFLNSSHEYARQKNLYLSRDRKIVLHCYRKILLIQW